MNKKKIVILAIPITLLILVFSNLLSTQAETIVIEGIKAHDFYTSEPDTYEEVAEILLGDPPERTGYSGILYVCENKAWKQIGDPIRTDDSGRDKTYLVSDYKDEIIEKYGYEVYEKALASGLSLVYDQNKGKKVIYSSEDSGTQLPCEDGEGGYFYNNLDFWLTLTFTVEVEEEGLKVIPPTQTINVGDKASYQAIYTNHNGNTFDVTEDAIWSVDNEDFASSDGYGKYTGKAKGETEVTASYDGMKDEAKLIVIGEGDVIPTPEPEPEPEPNIPPVAIIDAPEVVEIGETFCINSNSYDTDGEIVINDWSFNGELDKDDEEGFTESTTRKCGVYYENVGEQEIWLQVTDDGGSSDDTSHKIEVVYPSPDADFVIKGYPIQNRAVWLEIESPYGNNETAERKFKITESVITIKALNNNNQSGIYVINDDLNNVDYNEIVELLFRNIGDYEITYYLKNNRGQSASETKIISITEDMIPTASVETSEVVYLNNQGKQTVSFEITSVSEDDIIGNNNLEIAWDSNNDGNFEDEIFTTISNTSSNRVNYQITKLGNYKLRLTSIESFDEPTYPSVVDLTTNKSTTHRKFSMTETTFKVENMAPVVTLTAKEQPEVEIIFNTGDVVENNKYTKAKIQSQINTNLLPKLAAEGVQADISIQEPEYYEDVSGTYFKKDGQFYFVNYESGEVESVTGFPEYGKAHAIDYEGNVYYTEYDEIHLYKYDRKTNSVVDIIDNDTVMNYAKNKIGYNSNTDKISNNRILRGHITQIIIGENGNIFARLQLIYRDSNSNNWDERDQSYIVEFSNEGEILKFGLVPVLYGHIKYVTDNNIYFMTAPYDDIYVSPLNSLNVNNGTSEKLFDNGRIVSRIISSGPNKDDFLYASYTTPSSNVTSYYYVKNGEISQMWDDSGYYLPLAGGNYFYIVDAEYYGPLRDHSSLVNFDYTLSYNSGPIQNGSFIRKSYNQSEYTMMPNDLSNVLSGGKIVSFGKDGTFIVRKAIRGTDFYMKDSFYKFDEKTKGLIKHSTLPYTYNEFEFFSTTDNLVLRTYKKSLAETLKDTKWKSETSTKYFVTLSDQGINDLPNEKEEVASLLNQDDVRYISIDTTSTKTVAQQLAAAIDEATLQVTTTYTDDNMKNSMTKIKDFVVGDVFPPVDPTIDIHLGVDDSQYSLSAIRTAINNILKPNLLNAGITDINISSEGLVNQNVNGQSVRKFNSNKENEYYILFKDTALTTLNLNHLVGDLLLQDAYFVGIGKQAAKTQFDTAINKNMYRGTVINQPSSLNDAMEKLSEYLINTIRERDGESVVYATTEANKVLYETSYWDFENNPKFKEVYKTIHDPSVFENDQGKTSFAQGNLPEIFTKVGLYKPSYQAQDNPLGSYNATQITQFEEYRKWSNIANNAKIYIHRLPVPEFNINFNKSTRAFSATNTAYDLDKRSINIGLGGGIAKQQFQWRKQGEIIWKNGLPPSPLEKATYEIKNEVTDFQNQTNYLIKEVNKIGPPVAEFTPNPSVIEQGDSVNFINTSYEPTGDDMVAKWYYKKSNSSSYTLFATGNYTNGVPNTNWNPTTSALNQIGIYDVKLVVTDEDGLTDEAIEQVEVMEKSNTPPVACMRIPTPNYIGDTITIINCASDEDGDTLTYSYEVTKPNGTKTTYNTGHSQIASNGNLKIIANVHPTDLGTWTIKQTVSDGTETATTSGTMVVLDQTVQGSVAHTEQWLKNIQTYNLEFPSRAFNLNEAAGLLEFFKGEKFMLNAVETEKATQVAVSIKNYATDFGIAQLREDVGNKWSGSLWHEDMYYTFDDQEILTFEFVAVFENGWIAKDEVQVKIRDENYWVQHTSY